MYRIPSPFGRVRSTLLASAAVLVSPFGAEAQTERPNSSAGDRHRAGTEAHRQRPPAPQRDAIGTRRPPSARSGAADRRRSGAGRSRRAGCPERAAGADRNQQHPGRRRDRTGRGLQEFNRRQYHQGHPGLRAGRLCAAEMGRGQQAFDPWLRAVTQLPSARHPALHGRHSDEHRRWLRRFPGDRSDRLPIRRGLEGRECAAVRGQLARRRHQFRDADGPRSVAVRGAVDVGASAFKRLQASRAAPTGRADYFVTGS